MDTHGAVRAPGCALQTAPAAQSQNEASLAITESTSDIEGDSGHADMPHSSCEPEHLQSKASHQAQSEAAQRSRDTQQGSDSTPVPSGPQPANASNSAAEASPLSDASSLELRPASEPEGAATVPDSQLESASNSPGLPSGCEGFGRLATGTAVSAAAAHAASSQQACERPSKGTGSRIAECTDNHCDIEGQGSSTALDRSGSGPNGAAHAAATSSNAGLLTSSAEARTTQARDVFAELVEMASLPSSPSRQNSPEAGGSSDPAATMSCDLTDAPDPFAELVRMASQPPSRDASPARSASPSRTEATDGAAEPAVDARPGPMQSAAPSECRAGLCSSSAHTCHRRDADQGNASGLGDLRNFMQRKAQCAGMVRLSSLALSVRTPSGASAFACVCCDVLNSCSRCMHVSPWPTPMQCARNRSQYDAGRSARHRDGAGF